MKIYAYLDASIEKKVISMFQFDYTKSLEHNIQAFLADVRLKYPTARVQMFHLYTDLKNAITSLAHGHPDYARSLPLYRRFELPVAVFNKAIGDMKKVGIIKTARDSQQVFLSDAAWELYKKSLTQADLIDALTNVLINAGVFTSHEEMRSRALADGALYVRDGENGRIYYADNPPFLWHWLRTEACKRQCEYFAVDFLRAHVWSPTAASAVNRAEGGK